MRFNDYLCLKIRAGSIAEVFVILPGKAIRASVDAAPIAIYGIAPAAFPIGCKRFCNDLFGGRLLKNLELCWRRLADILCRVFVIRIGRVFDVSHK